MSEITNNINIYTQDKKILDLAVTILGFQKSSSIFFTRKLYTVMKRLLDL